MKNENKKYIKKGIIYVVIILVLSLLWIAPLIRKTGPYPISPSSDEIAEQLEVHVRMLSEKIGERSVFQPIQLEAASDYIAHQFNASGYDVEVLPYAALGQTFKNIQAVKNGSSEIIIIGAHYDTIEGSPGADDNAAGIAVLLELARLVEKLNLNKTVRFVAFSTEEPPFFKSNGMGSLVYARSARDKAEHIVGMISLEMVGFYSDELGSQSYPLWYGLFYPWRGNFIGVISDFKSRPWNNQVTEALKVSTSVQVESAWGFQSVPGIDWSDHWSFWQQGYPAIMITDTGPYRNPHYHQKTDTPETLDYNRMAELTEGLAEALSLLAG
ncbi:MAG: M28 family peptidase [Nanoarchaeota archaeon]|nr:M28 family peptidase [Nanoarchaeota archaeon]